MSVDAKILWDTNEREIKQLADLMRKFGKEADLSDKQIKELEDSLDKMGKSGQENTKKVQKEMFNLNSIGKKVGGTILALFAVDRLIDYQKQIIKISAEYQRMEAVLTTALGSRSSAQIAMAQIQNFAKRTPFQVNQLTESYTKLANRGLIPANSQLTAMGDFAAASGKDMEQLVEAILDVNNTERWTELGLKVRTEGDTIKGTFKGMTIEAERTEEGALKMVQAFGEMEGVAGAMEGIAATTGGAISNLSDAIDQLLNTIGQAESGVIQNFTRNLSSLISALNSAIETDLQKSTQLAAEVFDDLRETFGDLQKEDDYLEAISQIKVANEEVAASFDEVQQELQSYQKVLDDNEKKLFPNVKATEEAKRATEILKRELIDINGEMMGNERMIEFLTKAMEKLGESTDIEWKDLIITVKDNDWDLDQVRKAKKDLEDLKEAIDSLTGQNGEFQFDDEIDKMLQDSIAVMNSRGDEFVQANEQVVEATKQSWELLKAHRREVVNGLIELGTTLVDSLFEINQQDRERELEALEADTEAKLALAGDNEERKAEILREAEQKRQSILRDQAEAEKKAFIFEQLAAIADVLIKRSVAIAGTLPLLSNPFTAGLALQLQGLINTQAGISVATIAAQTIPAFAEGIERVNGEGTETSDSIHAMLSKNERVVKAAHNKEIGYDMSNEELVAAAKFYKSMPGEVRSDLISLMSKRSGNIDQKLLASEISAPIVKQLKSQRGLSVTVDSYGARVSMVKDLERITYLEKRFGIKVDG